MITAQTIILIPVFEDEAAEKLFERISELALSECLLLIIDDGSITLPVNESKLRMLGVKAEIVRLESNIGHQSAIALGIHYAVENFEFEHLVIMDCDGEDKPEDIANLLATLENEQVDVAVAKRGSRVESFKFKIFYTIYKTVFRVLVGRKISFGNFMAMRHGATKRMANMRETWIHVASSLLSSRLKIHMMKIDRGRRYAGRSKMNFVGLTLHGLRAIMVFAENVLVRITLFCVAFSGLIMIGLVAMLVFKVTGMAIPGWFSTIFGILLLLLFQVAIIALLVLMLAGNLKKLPAAPVDYRSLIAEVVKIG